jgi:hypothetical protein
MRVAARLEVHVHRSAARQVACRGEGLLLGMWLAGLPMVALAREIAGGVKDDRADHRIRARPVVGPQGQFEGAGRPMQVEASVRICCRQSWQYTARASARGYQPATE